MKLLGYHAIHVEQQTPVGWLSSFERACEVRDEYNVLSRPKRDVYGVVPVFAGPVITQSLDAPAEDLA